MLADLIRRHNFFVLGMKTKLHPRKEIGTDNHFDGETILLFICTALKHLVGPLAESREDWNELC